MSIADKHWMAVYTKPRSEKKVAERIAAAGLEVYCPLQVTMRQWSDRKKKVKIPVFPSYVFVHIAEADRLAVLQDPGVMNFVYWLGKPAVIRDVEIDRIRKFLMELPEAEFEVVDYKAGDKVSIQSGPFAGMNATVRSSNQSTAELLIESLGMILRLKTSLHHINKTD